jgi:hypothetical protein
LFGALDFATSRDRDDYARWSDLGASLGRVVRHIARVDDAAPISYPFGGPQGPQGPQTPQTPQTTRATSAGMPAVSPADCCVICMDTFGDVLLRDPPETRGMRTTVCGHTFCSPCIEKWLADSVSCPACMRDLTPEGGLALRDERGANASASGASSRTGWFGAGNNLADDATSAFSGADHIMATIISEAMLGGNRQWAPRTSWQIGDNAPSQRSASAPPTPSSESRSRRGSAWEGGDPEDLLTAAYHFNQVAEIFGMFASRP